MKRATAETLLERYGKAYSNLEHLKGKLKWDRMSVSEEELKLHSDREQNLRKLLAGRLSSED